MPACFPLSKLLSSECYGYTWSFGDDCEEERVGSDVCLIQTTDMPCFGARAFRQSRKRSDVFDEKLGQLSGWSSACSELSRRQQIGPGKRCLRIPTAVRAKWMEENYIPHRETSLGKSQASSLAILPRLLAWPLPECLGMPWYADILHVTHWSSATLRAVQRRGRRLEGGLHRLRLSHNRAS
jgi:hypothetical protein